MKKTFIYALHDPRTWEIRYVGKANNPERRHRKPPRSHNRALRNFLLELRSFGMKPRVSILQTCSADTWQNWERFWIATVKAAGEKLLNIHEGGDGPLNPVAWNKGKKLSPEYRAKLSAAHIGKTTHEQAVKAARASKGMLGHSHSIETKKKMSRAALLRVPSDEHRANLSSSGKAAWANPEMRKRIIQARSRREN